jgi:hypothetical protein
MCVMVIVDRFKSLHNSGRFVNNNTNAQQLFAVYS